MPATAAPAAPKGRLGNGQLRRQVAEYLTEHCPASATGGSVGARSCPGLLATAAADTEDPCFADRALGRTARTAPPVTRRTSTAPVGQDTARSRTASE